MCQSCSLNVQVNLAKMVAKQPGPTIEINTMTDLFLQRNAVREATAFLLDALQDNKPEQAQLQTKVRHRSVLSACCNARRQQIMSCSRITSSEVQCADAR